jgi:flagellar basal body-associated protein FliL
MQINSTKKVAIAISLVILLFICIVAGSAIYLVAINNSKPITYGETSPSPPPFVSPSPSLPSVTSQPTLTPSPLTSTSSPTQQSTPTPTPTITSTPIPTPTSVDLQTAITQGIVQATVEGMNLQQIKLNLKSNTDHTLEITVKPGTTFISQSSGVQNMVSLYPTTIYLEANANSYKTLSVACISMNLETPSSQNSFAIGESTSADLLKLLNLRDFQDATFRVKQFAIWTITDNPTRNGYVGLTTGAIGSGPSDDEMQKILQLFINAGINTQNYRALQSLVAPTPVPTTQT